MKLRATKKPESVSDEQLIANISNQDKQALDQLYQRYRHPLGAFLNRKLYDKKLTDEVFNDVMFTIWNKAASFRGDSKASTWIFGIAYRTILMAARKESKHNDKRTDIEPNEFDQHIPVEVGEPSNPMVDQLELAISQLSDNHKSVIELAYFEEMSLEQISNIIDVPLNTVKTRLFHARQYLKKILSSSTV